MGPVTLRVVSAAGTAVGCGVSGLLVAIDPKPSSAPLKPAVAGAAESAHTGGLVIPPSCGTAAVLAPLSPDQRQQLVAHARQQQRRGAVRGATLPCSPQSGAQEGGTIAPSISDAPSSTTPVANSYVS
jgi:hypothetical protein